MDIVNAFLIACFHSVGFWSRGLMVRISGAADQGGHGQWRTLRGACLRIDLRPKRHRSSNNQAQAPLDQRPGRADKPDDQGGNHQALLLSDPRPTAQASRQLRGRLQLREAAQDTQGPRTQRIYLQMLDKWAPTLHLKSAPSNLGTKHRDEVWTGQEGEAGDAQRSAANAPAAANASIVSTTRVRRFERR